MSLLSESSVTDLNSLSSLLCRSGRVVVIVSWMLLAIVFLIISSTMFLMIFLEASQGIGIGIWRIPVVNTQLVIDQ